MFEGLFVIGVPLRLGFDTRLDQLASGTRTFAVEHFGSREFYSIFASFFVGSSRNSRSIVLTDAPVHTFDAEVNKFIQRRFIILSQNHSNTSLLAFQAM
jgi:hypothetical protein